MKGNIWIPGILGVFCLQTLESGILGFGIQCSAQRIPSSDWNPQSTIHNPRSIGKESRIQFLASTIHSMESRIQDCLGLPYTGQWFPSPVGGGGDLYSLIYRVCTLF